MGKWKKRKEREREGMREKRKGERKKEKVGKRALAGVAQWIDCRSAHQRVMDLIPSRGTCLGCGPGPQCGAQGGQLHIDVSLPLFPLPFPSL